MINQTSIIKNRVNNLQDSPRVAWLLHGADAYYQPIMSEFTQLFPQTQVFTACWSGFLPGFEDSFTVKKVGKIKILSLPEKIKGYSPSFTYLPLSVVKYLWQFKPQVIFSIGFSIWTILILLLKIVYKWKVVIVYDGSSPGVDYQNSWLRQWLRRTMAKFVDAYITNNQSGKAYLTKGIGARESQIFSRPYLIPHLKTYLPHLQQIDLTTSSTQQPIFIFAGKIVPRKGLFELLKACSLLQEQGYEHYTLLVVGDGWQRLELESFVKERKLDERVKWVGYVEYERVGAYFKQADVFIFSTLEDVWGLVAVEAMMFGKPIICSQWAGASEMVIEGENGYIFDPHQPEQLAQLMSKFIDNPNLIEKMGRKSEEIMSEHTPEAVAQSLAEVVKFVLKEAKS
jgi:glycosyltransferase involved in cell wall biosynthesis